MNGARRNHRHLTRATCRRQDKRRIFPRSKVEPRLTSSLCVFKDDFLFSAAYSSRATPTSKFACLQWQICAVGTPKVCGLRLSSRLGHVGRVYTPFGYLPPVTRLTRDSATEAELMLRACHKYYIFIVKHRSANARSTEAIS